MFHRASSFLWKCEAALPLKFLKKNTNRIIDCFVYNSTLTNYCKDVLRNINKMQRKYSCKNCGISWKDWVSVINKLVWM